MCNHTKYLQLFSLFFIFSALMFCPFSGTDQANAADQKNTPVTNPCTLIAKHEAESIMETVFDEGHYSEHKIVGKKTCLYEAADKNSFIFLQVSVTQDECIAPKVLASGQNGKTLFASTKNAFPDREHVENIGDDAFIASPGIHIVYGNYYVTIAAGNIKSNKNRLINAGAKAIANLKASL